MAEPELTGALHVTVKLVVEPEVATTVGALWSLKGGTSATSITLMVKSRLLAAERSSVAIIVSEYVFLPDSKSRTVVSLTYTWTVLPDAVSPRLKEAASLPDKAQVIVSPSASLPFILTTEYVVLSSLSLSSLRLKLGFGVLKGIP